jgi:RimJ/RimL family protein N-acetyltransferase
MIFTQTRRLIIRAVRPGDEKALLPSWSDPEMTRYTGVRDDVPGFLASMLAEMQGKQPGEMGPNGPWYQYIAERRGDGAVVGDLGVGFGVPGERQVELGYRILPGHHRQGYAREAVTALIDHLIERHNVHRFVGVAALKNRASVTLLRDLGFRQEGEFRQSFWCNGEWLDDAYFAMLASEWRGGSRRAEPRPEPQP